MLTHCDRGKLKLFAFWRFGNEEPECPATDFLVKSKSMDFSKMELAVNIAEALTYDDRQPPNWHGHVGSAHADAQGLLITRSYASPQAGCNPERLAITLVQGRVRLSGYDDFEQHIDLICPLTLEAVLGRAQKAVANGVRSVAGLVAAIRTSEASNPSMPGELVYEF